MKLNFIGYVITAIGILFSNALYANTEYTMMSDCDPDFEIVSQELTADGWLVQFENTSEAEGGIGEVIWNFGDGTTSTEFNASHLYTTAGEFEVCITITSATGICSESECDEIEVGETDGDCEADWDNDVDGLTVTFTNNSESDAGTIISYSWTFGDGETSEEENPTHTYSEEGEYEVCLSISTSEGCFNAFCNDVDVEGDAAADCIAFFSVDEIIITEDEGFEVVFINETSGDTEEYSWSFGDGSVELDEENPTHLYSSSGTFTICLTIGEDGTDCYDEYCTELVLADVANAINEVSSSSILIYPNPAAEYLQITSQHILNSEMQIVSLTGERIYSTYSNSLNTIIPLNSIPSGTYLLTINNGHDLTIESIIIQH